MSEILPLLVNETGLSMSDLLRMVETAPRRYKVFKIPKRNGGEREIAQPSRELKVLQRVLMVRLLSPLPLHEAAKAYRAGHSILDNARPHLGHLPILKMDFSNFFPSIRSNHWQDYCAAKGLLSAEDRLITSNIFFRRAKGERVLRLSIGAPSSPMLSNLLLFEFDEIVNREARTRGISYTRYADDLTFSGQRTGMLKDMQDIVIHATAAIGAPRIQINADKTTFVTAKWRRTVTGVVLSNDGTPSLGHGRKRLLRASVHHASVGKLSVEEMQRLAGQLSFAKVVEPAFLARLDTKYGPELLRAIRQSTNIRDD